MVYKLIIIYDFDGTLTPYPLPQYEVLIKCGYDDNKILNRVVKEMKEDNSLGQYEAFFKCFKDVLKENNISMTKENICLGAENIKYNEGVIEYFEKYQRNTQIKHYVITSGIKDYIDNTIIRKYLDDAYGTTFKEKDGILQDIDILVTDKKKVDIIKKIRSNNNQTDKIIYFGDGFTDMYAFEYVHGIGGKTVFVKTNEESKNVYSKLSASGVIDECFDAIFSESSQIDKYISNQINE